MKEKCKARGAGLWFGGEGDRGYQIRSVLWAANFWNMSEGMGLQRMMGYLAEVIVRKEMEPKQESLCWTSTCEGARKFCSSSDTDTQVVGSAEAGMKQPLRKCTDSWFKEAQCTAAKSVSLKGW